MPTDDERRRIAAKLRANAGTEYIEVEPLCEAIGCDARRGSGEGIVWNRLADLIEPAPPHCIAEVKISGDELEGCVNRAITEYTGIDRDALLALADEIDRKSNDGSTNPDPMRPLASSLELFDYARRIRKACGWSNELAHRERGRITDGRSGE